MAFVIAEPCIDHNDQSCVAVCPVDCISSYPGLDRKFYIDPDNCIDCGSCEQACPNGAIFRAEVFTTGDYDIFPLWYIQVCEGTRPDVAAALAALEHEAVQHRQRDPQQARAAIDAYLPAPAA